jgi:glycosyltransferase involved in cell wall biosynthesis
MKKITVAHLPPWYETNPYLKLLSMSLQKKGINIIYNPVFNAKWLNQEKGRVDILHFHWIHDQFDSENRILAFKRGLHFILLLLKARILGYKILFTAHNIAHHECRYPIIDFICRLSIIHLSSFVFVHCNFAKEKITKRFLVNSKKVQTIPHGNYIGWYLNNVDKKTSRAYLKISQEKFVYLFFGLIRKYKGIKNLIDVFKKMEKDENILVIAGMTFNEEIKNFLEKSIQENIILDLRYIPSNEVQYYFNACDVVVLPYLNILTSGSLLLAMTFGKPIIIPKIGCIPEIMNEKMGIMYNPNEEESLLKALNRVKDMDLKVAGMEAHKRASDFDWDGIASKIIDIYSKVVEKAK